MASTTIIVKKRIPHNGETSALAGSYAKAVNDAVAGAATIDIASVKSGSYIITTIHIT
jgi:hypothetical protein